MIEQPAHAIIVEQAIHVAVRVRGDDCGNVRPELIAQVTHHLCGILVLFTSSPPSTVVVDAPVRAE
jgi:hypothetical protein